MKWPPLNFGFVSGLSGPTATYLCRFCFITKEELTNLISMYKSQISKLQRTFIVWFHLTNNVSGVGQWTLDRSNAKREELKGTKNPKGYVRDSLIHLEATSCPPDLLHLTNGVISKQFNQVSIPPKRIA